MEQQVTPEQLTALTKLATETKKELTKVSFRLFAMTLFFSIVTFIVGGICLPGSDGFIALGTAMGVIFALVDAIEGSEAISKKFRAEEAKILGL